MHKVHHLFTMHHVYLNRDVLKCSYWKFIVALNVTSCLRGNCGNNYG